MAGLGTRLAAGGTPYLYLYWKRQGRFKKFDAQLPEAIDLMARALRAGHAIISAVEIVSEETSEPLAAEFRTVFDEQNLGLAIREALLNLVSRVPTDGVRFLATAILLQKETGGNLAEIMDKAASVMRERIRLKGQLRVYTAQGRMTGWFLCCLPFFVFGLISVVNRDYERLLWTSAIGVRLIYGALALMVSGSLCHPQDHKHQGIAMNLPFLIVFGLALLVSFFALIFVLSRPSKESVLLAEVAQSVLPTQHRSATRGLGHAGGSGKASGVSPKIAGPRGGSSGGAAPGSRGLPTCVPCGHPDWSEADPAGDCRIGGGRVHQSGRDFLVHLRAGGRIFRSRVLACPGHPKAL